MVASKPAHQRQRRNKTSTHATLVRDHNVETPPLPERAEPWHELTVQWWYDIWASPMAPEFEKTSDTHGLYLLAQLHDDFWSVPADKPRARAEIAGEIRLQEQRFGLSPMDRRRLQWQIEATEAAQDKGRARRARTIEAIDPADDPRSALYSAS